MTAPISDDVRIRILAERGAGATQVLRGTRQELAALKGESINSSLAVQRMNREFAATRTQLAGAQARVNAASVAMTQLGTTTVKARQGIGTIRSTLFSLTAMMVGAKGTVGTLAGGLAQFAVGNAVAIGIIGGIMAIAGAYRLLTRRARETREEVDKVRESLRKQREEQPAREARGAQLALAAEMQRLESNINELKRAGAWEEQQFGAQLASTTERQAKLQRELDQVTRDYQQTLQNVATEHEKLAKQLDEARTAEIGALGDAAKLHTLSLQDRLRALEIEKDISGELKNANLTLAERNRLTKELLSLQGLHEVSIVPRIEAIGRPEGGPTFETSGLAGSREAYQMRKRMMALGAGLEYEIMPLPPIDALVDQFEGLNIIIPKLKITTEQWIQAAILGVESLAQSIIGGGGGAAGAIGGLLGIAGGFVSLLPGAGPTVGLGLATLGGLIGAIGRRGDPVPVRLESVSGNAAQAMRGPTEIILQIIDPVTGNIRQVYRAMHDLTRLDANPRLPFGFGGFYG